MLHAPSTTDVRAHGPSGRKLACRRDRAGTFHCAELGFVEILLTSEIRGFPEEKVRCLLCGQTWRRQIHD